MRQNGGSVLDEYYRRFHGNGGGFQPNKKQNYGDYNNFGYLDSNPGYHEEMQKLEDTNQRVKDLINTGITGAAVPASTMAGAYGSPYAMAGAMVLGSVLNYIGSNRQLDEQKRMNAVYKEELRKEQAARDATQTNLNNIWG
jgi:hypothetical protein